MAMVLLIDGPSAGQIYPYEHGKPIVHDRIERDGDDSLDDFLAATYTQVRNHLYGAQPRRLMHFGTEEDGLPDEALNSMYWAWMATPLAKQAAEPARYLAVSRGEGSVRA